MDIAAAIAAGKRRELRTLVLDVERLPGRFTWDERYDGLTIEGAFWSLSDYKHKFGRIPHDKVTRWPRTICAAWRWYGEKPIHFAAEWEAGGAAGFAEQIRDAMNDADIITGHYVKGADLPWLNSLFRDHGLAFPSPSYIADTYTAARKLGDESKKLDALCTRYGIPTKQGAYDAAVAEAACAGDKKAQRTIKPYNMADVEASTGLYAAMLPLFNGHPHVRPTSAAGVECCPRCGSEDVQRNGIHATGVYFYARYLCRECTGWHKSVYEGRGPSVRAL